MNLDMQYADWQYSAIETSTIHTPKDLKHTVKRPYCVVTNLKIKIKISPSGETKGNSLDPVVIELK